MMKKDILSGNHKILSSLPEMSCVIVYSMLTLLCGCQATYHNSDADISGSTSATPTQTISPSSRVTSKIRDRDRTTMQGEGLEKVEYLTDSIFQKEGRHIRLLGGSSWVLNFPSLALVTEDIIIVFQEMELGNNGHINIAVAYLDGDEIPVRHVGGTYVTQTGYLTTVVRTLGDGAVLVLSDGSFLSVPKYDQFHTSW